MTAHVSAHQVVATGAASPGRARPRVLLRMDLMRTDEGPDRGETVLYVQGESDAELNLVEARMWLADLQAFAAKAEILVEQMGA